MNYCFSFSLLLLDTAGSEVQHSDIMLFDNDERLEIVVDA